MIVQDKKSYIGIDVSKDILDVYILPNKKYMQFKNDAKGIKKLISKLKVFSSSFVVMEATGGYQKLLAKCLYQSNIVAAVLNPRQIRDFARALGKLAKTDRLDAETIAMFGQKMKPMPNVVYDENHENLSQNAARRRQLIDMITMEKNRLHHANKELNKSIKRVLKVLEKELDEVSHAIENTIQSHDQYRHKHNLLQSITGIGTTTSAAILTDLPELGSISSKQISALAGLAPFNHDSGLLRGKRTIRGGRAPVRKALYMATLVAMRFNERIKSMYQRLCNAGKPKKVAIVACMRKLLIIMNAMIKNDQPWHTSALS